MALLSPQNFILILLLCILQFLVPVGTELLVLLQVGLFTLRFLLVVHENHLLHLTVEILLLQLCNPILCHFSLDVPAFVLHLVPVLLECIAESKLKLVKFT